MGVVFCVCENMETTCFSLVIRGHQIRIQGSMETHTRPNFAVCKGSQQVISIVSDPSEIMDYMT